jgi:hypothetical protein
VLTCACPCYLSLCSRQVLPRLLDREVRKHLARAQGRLEGLQGAVEVLLGEVFAETERTLSTVRGRLGAAAQVPPAASAYLGVGESVVKHSDGAAEGSPGLRLQQWGVPVHPVLQQV